MSWADDAMKESHKLSRLADKEAGINFIKKMGNSIDEGGRDMHAYVRDEEKEGTSIRTADGWVSNVMEVLENHTKYWKEKWTCDDPHQVERAAEAIKHLREKILAGDFNGSKQDIKDYEPDELRKAASGFKGNTSIGGDGWTFKEIMAMPDIVLKKLGHILADCKREIAMPLQTYLNIMASIPKKTGGSRTVAVASTFYRLLMALDNARLMEFEKMKPTSTTAPEQGRTAARQPMKEHLRRSSCRSWESQLAQSSGITPSFSTTSTSKC